MKNLAARFFRLIVIALFSLFTFLFSLVTSPSPPPAFAEAPNPQPCQQPEKRDDMLTDNWLTDDEKKPPGSMQVVAIASGASGSTVTAQVDAYLEVNFSELSAIFGPTNSNYLEGKAQDKEHKEANVGTLSQVDISKFNGAVQKGAPIAWLDAYRLKYVDYINTHSTLAESGDKFADSGGNESKTIHELVERYGNPEPPSVGGNKETWQNGWGRYWEKLPTTYSQFYQAYIEFRAQHKAGLDLAPNEDNGDFIGMVLRGALCPNSIERKITFVMPEFFRTTAVSGEVNTLLVPKKAQSCASNNMILENNQNQDCGDPNIISKVIDKCLKALSANPVTNALKKVIKISLEWFSPPPALALEPTDGQNPDCIRAYPGEKKGQAPYCALPESSLEDGDRCDNQQDQFKLDRENPRVICTFKIHWQREGMILSQGELENQFDKCTPVNAAAGQQVTCSVAVYVWPIFRIPFQTEIWNNTLFSDTQDNEPYIGSAEYQQEGRPGAYSFFTPYAVFASDLETNIRKCLQEVRVDSEACQEVINYVDENIVPSKKQDFEACVSINLVTNPQGMVNCIVGIAQHLPKKRPGKSVSTSVAGAKTGPQGEVAGTSTGGVNRRFIGGTDCSKEFVWHNALYPKAAQEKYGITNDCPTEAAAQRPDYTRPPEGSGNLPTYEECQEDSGIPHPDDGNDSNGMETSVEELICAIRVEAGGKTEQLSGDDLADVMIRVMLGTPSLHGESGGNQCAFAAAAEVGIFQFTAETWSGMLSTYGLEDLRGEDSGTVHGRPPIDGSTETCWGLQGQEPTATATPPLESPDAFDWVAQFGQDKDGGAWDPFAQIYIAAQEMETNGGCRWSVYKTFYPGKC